DGSDGQPVYFLGERIGSDGADIHTTMSLALQQAAMNLMRTPKFAVHGSGGLTVNPTTGEVLAMTSNPIYDPTDFPLGFQPGITAAQQNGMQRNRAVQEAQPIGSVFKLTTLSAALASGVPADRVITCPGFIQVPGQPKPTIDDDPQGHGPL